jgi:hypothetical protein
VSATETTTDRRRVNITHLVAAGVLVAALPTQWLVSTVSIASVQILSPRAGWEMAPVVVMLVALVGLLVHAISRPEPIPGLIRSIGVQALVLAGAVVLFVELVLSVLGIVWDAGSGGLRAGAGVWMTAIGGLLLVVVGDHDPLGRLMPTGNDTESSVRRLGLAGVWLLAIGTAAWWTAWRNTTFAEIGSVQIVASAIPIIGVVSLVGVIGCWLALALALAGRRRPAGVTGIIAVSLLGVVAAASSVTVWATDLLPVNELVGTVQERTAGWIDQVELPEAIPAAVRESIGNAVESADVTVDVSPTSMLMMVLLTGMGLLSAVALSRVPAADEPELIPLTTSDAPGRPVSSQSVREL